MPDADAALIAALTSGTWKFGRADGSMIYEDLTLLADGKLTGAHAANETAWAINQGQLVFLDAAGVVTTRFTDYERDGASLLRASGPYVRGGDASVIHFLFRPGARPTPAASAPTASTPAPSHSRPLETTATCVWATSLAAPPLPQGAWPGPAASLLVAPAVEVPITDLPGFTHGYSSAFPDIVSQFFAAPAYESVPWTFTFLDHAVLAGGAAILTARDGAWLCLNETLGHISWPALHRETPTQFLHKEERAPTIDVRLRDFEPPYDDDALNVILSPINNYGHWHIHNVTVLFWLARHAPWLLGRLGARRVRLLCPAGFDHVGAGMKRAAVERLARAVPTEMVDPMRDTGPRHLRNVLVSSSLSIERGPLWPPLMRDLFAEFRRPPNPAAPRFVYCNRGHAGQRGITNEPELEAALTGLGVTSVSPGRMSFDEQRDAFTNAQIVIGAHGAALTNMVYAHQPPLIVELTRPAYGATQYGWFRHLAAAFGGAHGAAISPIPPAYQGKSYNEVYFEVDVSRFVAALRPLLDLAG